MRVCFFAHSAGRGGAGRALQETVEALADRGTDCRVVLPARGPLGDALSTRGIRVSVFPYTWWMGRQSPLWKRTAKLAINAAAAPPLALRLRAWRCDVACSNGLTICAGAWAARLAGVPHVWHIHEYGREHHGLTFELGEARALRQIVALSSAVVAPSRALAERFGELTATRLHVVQEAVAGPAHEPTARVRDNVLRCVIVGALQEGKAQDEAIRAVALLARRDVPARLTVVGAGEAAYEQRLRALARDEGVADRVHFTGFVDDPLPLIEQADVALVCSRWEAFGRTTVEAMLCARPVVAARSGATPELVQHAFNGLLYEPGDVPALADALRQLAADPAAAAAMGARGRAWAREQFAPARHGAAMQRVLETAAAGA